MKQRDNENTRSFVRELRASRRHLSAESNRICMHGRFHHEVSLAISKSALAQVCFTQWTSCDQFPLRQRFA